jgi:chromosome segregation ATPase
MENKQTYIVQNEIKVKNLLSDMYNNESSLLGKISKKKDHLNSLKKEIREMEKDYENQNQLRNELTEKFEDLQESNSSDWEKFRREYELVLDFAEGDRFSFIETAETFMDELNEKIGVMEEKVKEASADAKKKSQEMLDELNERRSDLQERLEEVKADSGERWMEFRQWFMERANSVRSLF